MLLPCTLFDLVLSLYLGTMRTHSLQRKPPLSPFEYVGECKVFFSRAVQLFRCFLFVHLATQRTEFAGLDTVPTRVRNAARGRTMGARNRTTVHVIQYASLIIENIYSEYYNSNIQNYLRKLNNACAGPAQWWCASPSGLCAPQIYFCRGTSFSESISHLDLKFLAQIPSSILFPPLFSFSTFILPFHFSTYAFG